VYVFFTGSKEFERMPESNESPIWSSGHQQEIQADRDRKLEAAREQRKNRRKRAA